MNIDWEDVRDIFEKVDYFKELKEYEKYENFIEFLEANFLPPEIKIITKLPPNHPNTFDETGYVKDEYNQFRNPIRDEFVDFLDGWVRHCEKHIIGEGVIDKIKMLHQVKNKYLEIKVKKL